MLRLALSLLLVFTFFSCDLFGIPPGGGGGETGGGTGSNDFSKGFVFVRKADGNVYVADDSDTSSASALTSAGASRHPSLSVDKQRVVFVTGTGDAAVIATVPSTGGAVSTVLTSSAQYRDFRTPVFSPSGARIAFSYADGAISRIGVVDIDGTGLQTLASTSPLSYATPSWSPDGTALYVAAGSALSELTQVERIEVASETVANVTNTLGLSALGISGRLAVSPDGAKAAFDARVASGATRIFTLDLSSKQVTQVYGGEAGGVESFPSWMDNGTLAFSSDTGGNDNLYSATLPSTDSPALLVPSAIEGWYSR